MKVMEQSESYAASRVRAEPRAPRNAHIVVVEREPAARGLLATHLARAGYRVTQAEHGAQLWAALPADLVLLDIELSGDDGFLLARQLRATSDVGIIIVTRRDEAIDRIVGLELGADDYIVKPPEMRELLVRVKNLLWRTRGAHAQPAAQALPCFGGFALDRTRHLLVGPDGAQAPLPLGEFRVLATLVDARGAIVPRDALTASLRGADSHSRSLDVLVNRLRRKLREGGAVVPTVLLTVFGVGYRLGVPVE